MKPIGIERHRWAGREAEVSGTERVNRTLSRSGRVDDIQSHRQGELRGLSKLVNITEDVRKYAAENALDETVALEHGMQQKAVGSSTAVQKSIPNHDESSRCESNEIDSVDVSVLKLGPSASSPSSSARSLFATLEQPRRFHPIRPGRECRRRTAPAQRLGIVEERRIGAQSREILEEQREIALFAENV